MYLTKIPILLDMIKSVANISYSQLLREEKIQPIEDPTKISETVYDYKIELLDKNWQQYLK